MDYDALEKASYGLNAEQLKFFYFILNSWGYLIRENVICNCSRQDYFETVRFLRLLD